MQKWEYKRLCVGADSIHQLDKQMEKMGQEGWGMVSVVHTVAALSRSFIHVWFKRPLN